MLGSRYLFATLLAASSLTACIDTEGDESLGESTSELSSTSWAAKVNTSFTLSYAPTMTMLDGFEYYVYADDTHNPYPSLTHDLYWHQCATPTNCTDPKRIPGQQSVGPVSLAAFNGYIYMVHQGDSDWEAVWLSRLDVTTGQWTTNVKLPVSTIGGSPALAVFNNRLYMVGSREAEVTRNGVTVTTYPLWYTSMGTNEVWSTTVNMNRESASPPSLAVLGNTMYVAHRNGANAEIMLQKMPLGGGWSAPTYITAGPNNSYIQGDDVQLAAVNGYLHLVHHRFTGDGYTYWTYNRGCDSFAPEISIDAFPSSSESMSTGFNGLLLNRLGRDSGLWPYTVYDWYTNRFVAPPAPQTAPQCGAI